jgi:hypothetical protein
MNSSFARSRFDQMLSKVWSPEKHRVLLHTCCLSEKVTLSEANSWARFRTSTTLLNIWSKSERANDEFIVLSSKPINIYFSLFSYRSVQRVSVFSSAFRNTQRIMCTALTRRLCDELKIPCYSSPEACSNQTKLRRTSWEPNWKSLDHTQQLWDCEWFDAIHRKFAKTRTYILISRVKFMRLAVTALDHYKQSTRV